MVVNTLDIAESVFLTDDLLMCSWLALCFLFRSASKVPANEKKERPLSTMSEASNYTGGSDYAANPSSPAGRVSDTHGAPIVVVVFQVLESFLETFFMD